MRTESARRFPRFVATYCVRGGREHPAGVPADDPEIVPNLRCGIRPFPDFVCPCLLASACPLSISAAEAADCADQTLRRLVLPSCESSFLTSGRHQRPVTVGDALHPATARRTSLVTPRRGCPYVNHRDGRNCSTAVAVSLTCMSRQHHRGDWTRRRYPSSPARTGVSGCRVACEKWPVVPRTPRDVGVVELLMTKISAVWISSEAPRYGPFGDSSAPWSSLKLPP